MKILLIVPHNPETTKYQMMTAGITPPLGLAYIASYLREAGYAVSILDNSLEKLSSMEFVGRVKAFNPDVVGIGALTSAVPNAVRLAELVKDIKPEVKVVMGGAHATALPKEVLKNTAIDVVIRGEGEETMLELVQTFERKGDLIQVKGISFMSGEGVVDTESRGLIGDLDLLPFPAYDLLPMEKYFLPASRRKTNRRVGSIITARGCPYQCTFCSQTIFGNKVRLRSPSNVVAELELLNEEYDVGELIFWDDTFNVDSQRAIEIARLIREKNLNIVWSCSCRVNKFSEALCSALSLAGCRQINFGVESGADDIRKNAKKGILLEEVEKAISICEKYNVQATCSFLFGLPGETWETALQTLEFAKKVNPDYAMFCFLVPMPGSELFDVAVAEGKIDLITQDWEKYVTLLSAAAPIATMGELTSADLIKLQKKVFREFYLRPKYIFKTLRNINSFEKLKQSLRGLHAIMRHQFARLKI